MLEHTKILYAMLFASPESVHISRLAEAIGISVPSTREILYDMSQKCADEPVQLREADDSYVLVTNPDYYPYVQKLLKIRPRRPLTRAILETLAIIAYRQPITKAVIEDIRGVNSDHNVNRLVEHGFVAECGRLEAPGRPMLFCTTEHFLLHFGIRHVDELRDSVLPISHTTFQAQL